MFGPGTGERCFVRVDRARLHRPGRWRMFAANVIRRDAMKMKLVALTRPLPGREAEYHAWYDATHLPELVTMFGMAGAQRYKLATRLMGSDENEFLAIYDIEADDPAAFLATFGAAAQSGKLTMSDAQDFASCYTALFTEHGERVVPG
jgi:hypothetical protein